MRLLIIDDDQSIVEVIEDGCTGLPNLQLAVAGSRDTALALVTNCDFDLVVCDLRLPTSEGAIDADTAHGLQVFTELRSRCPGTPILILSAYGTLDIVSDFLAQGHRDDPFGLGQSQPMITFMTKAKIRECVEEIRLAAFAKANLAAVTIAGSAEPGLSTSERSVVQLYARKSGGVTVSASALGGGMSGSKTFRLEIHDGGGALTARVVGKVGDLAAIQDEARRYNDHVPAKLPPAAFTALADVIKAGAGNTGGAFFTLAAGYDKSLFARLREDVNAAAQIVRRLSELLAQWTEGAPVRNETVAEVRRRLLSDASFVPASEGLGFDRAAIEALSVKTRIGTQHGDLHGENVLVNAEDRPVVIDFGSIRAAPCCLDAIALELSVFFHPGGAGIAGRWPSLDALKRWFDRDVYLAECPIAAFVTECRRWSYACALGEEEIAATLYAYAARQLTYKDTDKKLASGLIAVAAAKLL